MLRSIGLVSAVSATEVQNENAAVYAQLGYALEALVAYVTTPQDILSITAWTTAVVQEASATLTFSDICGAHDEAAIKAMLPFTASN